MKNLSAPFTFQEERPMKIEHAFFLPFFQNYGSVCRKVILMCSHDPIFGTNKIRILKNRSFERALRVKQISGFHSKH